MVRGCASTFTFTTAQNDGARKLHATTTLSPTLAKSISGGAIDVVRFFVDDKGDTHPSLAEAAWDPQSGRWDVQTLIEDVEDFQIVFEKGNQLSGTAANDDWALVGNISVSASLAP